MLHVIMGKTIVLALTIMTIITKLCIFDLEHTLGTSIRPIKGNLYLMGIH